MIRFYEKEKISIIPIMPCVVLVGIFLWYAIFVFPVVRAVFMAMLLINIFLVYKDEIAERQKKAG